MLTYTERLGKYYVHFNFIIVKKINLYLQIQVYLLYLVILVTNHNEQLTKLTKIIIIDVPIHYTDALCIQTQRR